MLERRDTRTVETVYEIAKVLSYFAADVLIERNPENCWRDEHGQLMPPHRPSGDNVIPLRPRLHPEGRPSKTAFAREGVSTRSDLGSGDNVIPLRRLH